MKHPKFLLMARGRSHIRYFNFLAENSRLDIRVFRSSQVKFNWQFLKYLALLNPVDINILMHGHFTKKKKAVPLLAKSWLWPIYKLLRTYLEYYHIAKYCALIVQNKADVVGVWNGQKLPGAGFKMASELLEKEVIYFENGLMPNTTVCDWQGVNARNSLPCSGEFYRRFKGNSPLPQGLIPRKAIKAKPDGTQSAIRPTAYIFVPFQVETDSQIVSNSPWIDSMDSLFSTCMEILDKNKELNMVFKEHPCEKKNYRHLYNRHKRAIFINNLSTETLISHASAVITVNSTVGLESILLDKKVLVLGNACYSIQGLSFKARDIQELQLLIEELDALWVDTQVREGFLAFINEHYAIPTSWDKADSKHLVAIEQRLVKSDKLAEYTQQVTTRARLQQQKAQLNKPIGAC